MQRYRFAPAITCSLILSFLLTACGGGSSAPPTPPPVAAPTGLSYTSPVVATQNAALTTLTPTVTGTVSSYSVSPALPAGVSLNATTGAISGTPTAFAAQATFMITATNASGSTSFNWMLTVNPAVAVSGTAAAGAPITSAMNGMVIVKDSSSPAKTATTTTDAAGKYSFTTKDLQGFMAPLMVNVDYQVGGVHYNLNSAVATEDLAAGNATINITPLTDLVIANLANEIASRVFTNGNYASLLTKAALDGGVVKLDALLKPVLLQMGVSASADLLRQSFAANGSGLDAVLDALKVNVDPVTKTQIITNRLNNASITGTLSAPPTTPISTPATSNLSDLQAITALFNNFSTIMARAPAATDPALLAFFDQTAFLYKGANLASFLQMITSNPTVAGGALTFNDIVLGQVPSWATVPAGATAYAVRFTVLRNKTPNSSETFIVYSKTPGTWLMLGDQHKVKSEINSIAGSNGVSNTLCSGLLPNVKDSGAIGVSYALVKGPGLPAAGLLLFSDGTSNSLMIAAGDVTSYAGTSTAPASATACGFNSIYPMTDMQIQSIGALPALYSFEIYNDNATPANRADDKLLATYQEPLLSAPLQQANLTAALFATQIVATPSVLSAAPTGATVTISWKAPATTGLYGQSVNVWVSNATTGNSVYADIAADQTSVKVAIPLLSNPTNSSGTVEYLDSGYRYYWASAAAGF
ncbi:MAG: putative Ig domain-containing protein [Gammaproteobacteria bacterium]|nr:putative Ig domain-containing protein [Gammaproteobacteria bacterium]